MNRLSRLVVVPVRALDDNYMYLLWEASAKKAFLVDPVEPNRLIQVAKEQKVDVVGALITHHHYDHAGGNKALREILPSLKIYGGDDRIPEMNVKVKDGEVFTEPGFEICCLHTPCHTRGHVCYVVCAGEENAVFSGDTLFIAGCGKFFEGSGAEMYENLNVKLARLPGSTKVYPGHEYTSSNLSFAHHVEPSNQVISAKLSWSRGEDAKGRPTVPSSIAEEKEINPFMRVTHADVQAFTGKKDPIDVITALREKKNNFKAPNL